MAIVRQEKDLTDEYLAELLEKNQIDRNEDLLAFLRILDDIEEGLSIFIDGKWGSGKTVFVKQAILTLKAFHGTYKETLTIEIIDSIGNALEGYSPNSQFMPVYLNALENDIYEAPILALLSVLIMESEENGYGKTKTDSVSKITSLADAILKPLRLDVFANIKEGFSPKDLLESRREILGIQSNISKLITEMLMERAEKMVLFVDELDRCNPSFALKLLEHFKFLFNLDNVIVVFSTNVSQLAHTVEGHYGSGFNGHGYLTRYYDLKVELSNVRPSEFLEKNGYANNNRDLDGVVFGAVDKAAFSMRDCHRYFLEIEIYKKVGFSNFEIKTLRHYDAILRNTEYLVASGMAPIILMTKIKDTDLYDRIMGGSAEEEFLELAISITPFHELLLRTYEFVNKVNHYVNVNAYFKDVYRVVFAEDDNLARRLDWSGILKLKKSLFSSF